MDTLASPYLIHRNRSFTALVQVPFSQMLDKACPGSQLLLSLVEIWAAQLRKDPWAPPGLSSYKFQSLALPAGASPTPALPSGQPPLHWFIDTSVPPSPRTIVSHQ